MPIVVPLFFFHPFFILFSTPSLGFLHDLVRRGDGWIYPFLFGTRMAMAIKKGTR